MTSAIRAKSLDSLINDMAGRLEVIKSDESCDLDRTDVLAAVDPVLASLNKEYKDAKARHEKLVMTNGENDAMVEVSGDVVDSALSAVQTRILELEEQAEGEGTEALEIRRRIRREQARHELLVVQRQQELKKEQEEFNDTFFWMMVWTWITQQTFAAARRTLSASSAFSTANPRLGRAWHGAQVAA